jgi:ACS family glucarate transporter-like MFS transporter
VLAVAIFWWSAFTAITAIAGELFLASLLGVIGSFIVMRVLIGAGEAAALPNRNRLVANWIPPHERALAIGIGGSGSMLGAALTPPLIVAIMLTLGWRAAFYLAGAVGTGIAVLWYWLARDREGGKVLADEIRQRRYAQSDLNRFGVNLPKAGLPQQCVEMSDGVLDERGPHICS